MKSQILALSECCVVSVGNELLSSVSQAVGSSSLISLGSWEVSPTTWGPGGSAEVVTQTSLERRDLGRR